MSNFFAHFLPGRRSGTPEPTAGERVLAHRERLLGVALQILDDPEAAREVVLRGLLQAMRSPLLLHLTEASPGPEGPVAPERPERSERPERPERIERSDQALSHWLDRLIVGLCLRRLRGALPEPAPVSDAGDAVAQERSSRPAGSRRTGEIRALALAGVADGAVSSPSSSGATGRLNPMAQPGQGDRADPINQAGQAGFRPRVPPLVDLGARRPRSADSVPAERTAAADPTQPVALPASPTLSRSESAQIYRTAQALRTLPPETRVTLVLVVMQRRSPAEAAELLGCSEDSLGFWLNHGRKLLRRALQRDLIEGDFDPKSSYSPAPPGAIHDLRRGKKATARA